MGDGKGISRNSGRRCKGQNMLDKTDMRPTADHVDIFQHVFREWTWFGQERFALILMDMRSKSTTKQDKEKRTSWWMTLKQMEEEREDLKTFKSSSTSRQVDILSDSAEETPYPSDFSDPCLAKMDQKHSKLGVKTQVERHVVSERRRIAALILPPWRDRSFCGITTTKTFEGLLGQANCGPQKQHKALLKKHAIECTKLMKEYEYWKAKEQEDIKSAGVEKKTEFKTKEND